MHFRKIPPLLVPLSSEHGTCTPVKAMVWPSHSDGSFSNLVRCSPFARERCGGARPRTGSTFSSQNKSSKSFLESQFDQKLVDIVSTLPCCKIKLTGMWVS